MENNRPNNISNHMIAGVIMIGLGVLFLLENLGLFSIHRVLFFWPLIFIVVGALKIVQQPNARGARFGGVLIVIGLVLFAGKLGLFQLTARLLFPAILIGVGIMILTKPGRRKQRHSAQQPRVSLDKDDAPRAEGIFVNDLGNNAHGAHDGNDEGPLDITAILGSYKRSVHSKNFRGGEITSILGGCELDLRQSSLSGEAILNVFVMCGGISIKIPPDWTVILQGTPVLGGFEERTVPPAHTDKRLVIRGPAVLGGVEVRN